MIQAVIVWYLITTETSLSINNEFSKYFVECHSKVENKNTLSCTLPPVNVRVLSSKVKCASYCASIGTGQESKFDIKTVSSAFTLNKTSFLILNKNDQCLGFNYQASNRMCQLFYQLCLTNNLISVTNKRIGIYYQAVNKLGSTCYFGEYVDCCDMPGTDPVDSGVYWIKVDNQSYPVYCQISENGTKYIVIQRRMDGSVNFYRGWTDYENGFGNKNGEYWLGNYLISYLTNLRNYKLKIELVAFDGVSVFAEYMNFVVGPVITNYTITISGYSGTAGDCMSYHNGQTFSTYDADNKYNCARYSRGAWWYNACHSCNLNGRYFLNPGQHSSMGIGINYGSFRGVYESMKICTMMITRK